MDDNLKVSPSAILFGYAASLPTTEPTSITGTNVKPVHWLHRREPKHISYGAAALKDEVARLDALAGQRQHQLYVAALRMGSLVAGDELRLGHAEAVLTDAGRHRLGLGEREVRKSVSAGLERGIRSPRTASAWGTIHDRNDAILFWSEWYQAVSQSEQFKGTRDSTLLRYFAAIYRKATTRARCRDVRFSVREASEMAGLSTNTVSTMTKAGGDVEASGWLKAVDRVRPCDPTSRKATTWRPVIKRPFPRQDVVPALGIQLSRKRAFGSPSANVLHRKANAWRLWSSFLCDEEVTVPELADAMGIKPKAVRTNLKFLEANGLAERVTRTTWRGTNTDADGLPSPDGVDYLARKRQMNAWQRALYDGWQKARAESDARRHSGDESGPAHDIVTGEILRCMWSPSLADLAGHPPKWESVSAVCTRAMRQPQWGL